MGVHAPIPGYAAHIIIIMLITSTKVFFQRGFFFVCLSALSTKTSSMKYSGRNHSILEWLLGTWAWWKSVLINAIYLKIQ